MNKIFKFIGLASLLILALFNQVCAKSRKSRGKNVISTQKFETKANLPSIQNILESPEPNTKELPKINANNKEKIKNVESKESEEVKAPEEVKTPEEVFLNFENAELSSFINYIAEIKKINILPDKSLSGNKISLNIRKPLSVDQAWNILHTVSDMAGFSIVKVGDVYKIVPKDKKLKEPLPSYINVPLETLPDSDQNIRYVAFLNNVTVSDVKALLDGMLGAQHAVIPQENVNGVIIIDKSFNIKSAMRIIQELDRTGLQKSVVVIKLKEANATEVRDLLKNLVEDKKQPFHPLAHLFRRQREEAPSNYFAPGTKIIAEERTNSLILLGTKSATEKIQKFIVESVDKQLVGVESPLHVYELQYMEAKQIVEILKEVTTSPDSLAGQQASKYGAVRSGVKYFKPMIFKADEEGNRIIVSSTDRKDWKLVKKTIQNLDKPQPQVAIETLIVTVDTLDEKSFGGQTRNKSKGMLGKGINFQGVPISRTVLETSGGSPGQPISLLGNLITGLTGGLGKTLLTFGRENNIWSIFEMLQRQTYTSVIAQPFLTVANKFEAEVVIGETRRVISQTVLSSTEVQGKKDAKAAIELKITPQINIDGIISLKINIKNNEFIDNNPDNKQKRELETSVSVANGQVLALGGFVKTKIIESVSKTPILGDIPLLGWFFKSKAKTLTKQNILMFISPTIVKPREVPGVDLYSRMKLHEAKAGIDRAIVTGKTMDPFHDWFFDTKKETYAHKVDDYATARYQPVTVDMKNDPYYRVKTQRQIDKEKEENSEGKK